MKKTILLILAVLPIVLVIIIAFAGRILSLYQHISVESVAFADDNGDPYKDDESFIVGMGESKSIAIQILPELASNKRATYTSADESICKVDKNGVVTGVHYGSTYITVKTDDGGKTDMIDVVVTADIPIGVTIVTKGDNNTPQIPLDTLELLEGEEADLYYIVDLPVAIDKRVSFTSSNESIVEVDPTGRLLAVSEGTATITVTTLSGNYSDSCEVTVKKGQLPLSFDLSGAPGVEIINGYAVISDKEITINILEYLIIREDINPDDVNITITSGNVDTLKDGVIKFDTYGMITVRAYVGDRANPTYFADISIAHRP